MLTVLSFGAGQDSTAILYKLIYDEEFRMEYAPDDLVVIMANTMNEHEGTYLHVERCKELCYENNIPFYLLDPSNWATGDWTEGYVNFLEVGNRIGSKSYPKTCTDKLKIQPIYKFLERYLFKRYDLDGTPEGRKRCTKKFAEKYGKINVLIGIAAGEEKRAGSNEESAQVWMRMAINKRYPLLDLGMDRQACQDYISSVGAEVPPPSNCILCPFMSEQELLYLYKFLPEWYYKWVELEAAKIAANTHAGDKNFGVWGKKLLPEKLEEAIKKYGHMTDEELKEYKMSHGHCVMSKY